MYTERRGELSGSVVWTAMSDNRRRVLPDGCMDLIWDGSQVFVAGPDTQAYMSLPSADMTFVGLRFAPGGAPAVLGVPAHTLRDQRVSISDLWSPTESRRWNEWIGSAEDPGVALEAMAQRRRRSSVEPAPIIAAVAAAMRADRSVASLAVDLGVGERQVHRLSLAAFGYGPKTLARILRLHRALDLIRAGAPPAESAARSGYADQPHLSRDVRRLAGVPLGQLLSE